MITSVVNKTNARDSWREPDQEVSRNMVPKTAFKYPKSGQIDNTVNYPEMAGNYRQNYPPSLHGNNHQFEDFDHQNPRKQEFVDYQRQYSPKLEDVSHQSRAKIEENSANLTHYHQEEPQPHHIQYSSTLKIVPQQNRLDTKKQQQRTAFSAIDPRVTSAGSNNQVTQLTPNLVQRPAHKSQGHLHATSPISPRNTSTRTSYGSVTSLQHDIVSGNQGQWSVSGNQRRLSGNQGHLSGNQGHLSGNQGYLSGNQGHFSGNQGQRQNSWRRQNTLPIQPRPNIKEELRVTKCRILPFFSIKYRNI